GALCGSEAGEVAARQRQPLHAVTADVSAAWTEAWRRRFVNLSESGVRGIGAGYGPNHISGISHDCSPDGTVRRTHCDGVGVNKDAFVLRRIHRLVGLYVYIALPVALGVEDEPCPSLRL